MQPSPFFRFLIVGGPECDHSMQVLQGTLAGLGSVEVATKEDLFSHLSENLYDAVIVDAGAVPDTATVVSRIREVCQNTRVVVITATPHWRVARAVFKAGAADYLRKSQSMQELRTGIRRLLE